MTYRLCRASGLSKRSGVALYQASGPVKLKEKGGVMMEHRDTIRES